MTLSNSETDTVLELSSVSVKYGSRDVFSNISLLIREGETHALLGPNGAGKTTLIRTILGRVEPNGGSVLVSSSGVGLVPQEIAVFPALTVRENLAAFARLSGLPHDKAHQRVNTVMEALELEVRENQYVAQLSGGWQRRVNVAVAILKDPALLILDEPTVGVDNAAKKSLQEVLRQLAANGTAILMTTHDFAEAEALCSHVILLKDGHCLAQGAVPDLLKHVFDGRYLVTVETKESEEAGDREKLEELGLEHLAKNRAEAIMPRDRALDVVSKISQSLGSLRGAGFEQPNLRTLYNHYIRVPECH